MQTNTTTTPATTPSTVTLPVGIANGNNGAHSKAALHAKRVATANAKPFNGTAKGAAKRALAAGAGTAVGKAKAQANARAGAKPAKLTRATLPGTTRVVPVKGAANVARPGTVRHAGIAAALKCGTVAGWVKAMASNAKVPGCKQASQAPGTWLRWLVAQQYVTLA